MIGALPARRPRFLTTAGLVLATALLAMVGSPGSAVAQQPVFAGLDLLETDSQQTFEDLSDLSSLCPGCFVIGNPTIQLRGVPLEQSPLCPGDLGNTDTIVRRLQNTPPLNINDNANIPIQIEELHLQSVEPFQVDCSGDVQLWMLDVTVDPQAQSQGQMLITRTHVNGGVFDSMLPVKPILTFTRVDDCPVVQQCQMEGPEIIFDTQGAPWSYTPPPLPVLEIPGCTSNFIAGLDSNGPPMIPGFTWVETGKGSRQRKVFPARIPKFQVQTWEETIHFAFRTVNSGVDDIDALRFFNLRWIPEDEGSPPDTTVLFKSNSICNLDDLWTTPTSWCRVNWDQEDPLFQKEAWWFFPSIAPGDTAPDMDVVFGLPIDPACPLPTAEAIYEFSYECYANCFPVDSGTFRFSCVLPPPPVGLQGSAPVEFRVGSVEQNFPNPFNPTTTIGYTLASPDDAQITIYNVKGEVVRVLDQGRQDVGRHQVVWDGRDTGGNHVSSGTYFYELKAGKLREARKMILLK